MSVDRTNVVIVGGGVIGCCAAYYLAEAGTRVTLLERGPLCSEASSANAGLVTVSRREGASLPVAQESQRLMIQASQEFETDFELSMDGSVTLLRSEEEVRKQQTFVEKQRQKGVDIRMVDRATALELEPGISPDILAAVYSPVDGTVNPYALTLAFARAARRLGATICQGEEATGLKAEGGRISGVITRGREVDADVVLVAAGAWSRAITRTVGLDIPVEPCRGQILLTEPSCPSIKMAVRDTGHIYIRRTGRGNILIGSVTEKVGYDKGLTLDAQHHFASGASALVPALRGAKAIRFWSGLRPLSPDNQSILGPIEGYEGLMLATGHSSTGVGLSTGTSKMVADLIMKGKTDLPIEAFSAARFRLAA